jgi:hypothetical protein
VIIERERLPNAESLHLRIAHAVGEAPRLIGKLLEDRVGLKDVAPIDPEEPAEPLFENGCRNREGSFRLTARSKKGERLVEDLVARHEPEPGRAKKLIGRYVMRIARHVGGKPGARIDKRYFFHP